MPSFCFIGHSFHKQTKSSNFMKDIVSKLGTMAEFDSSPDNPSHSDYDLLRELASSNFDCYIFWQTEYIAKKLLPLNLGRFVVAPMYDGAIGRSPGYWQDFVDTQFVSFSRAHHEILRSLECKSAYFKYFPELTDKDRDNLKIADRSAFFWERRPDRQINLSLILDLCKVLRISHLHVHRAHDFSSDGIYDIDPQEHKTDVKVTTSKWFASRQELDDVASKATFYFAPRATEGIGMSFLEAMGRGQIVVAPDAPTMNEYVCHGVTGILYNPDNPQMNFDLSSSGIQEMRKSILKKASFMRSEWIEDEARLQSILLADQRRWPTNDYSSAFAAALRRGASEKMSNNI